MKYVIIDVEATCWERGHERNGDHEIIELGCVFLDKDFNKIGELDIYTYPIEGKVSDYCEDLTGITQKKLDDDAYSFARGIEILKEKIADNKVILCSWGRFDQKQIMKDCERHEVEFPFSDEHIDIKGEFMTRFNKTKCGLQKACRILHLRFNGSPHNGQDDANAIAEVFQRLRIPERYEKKKKK